MQLEMPRTGSPRDGRLTQIRGESRGGKEDRTGAPRPREEEGGALGRLQGVRTVGTCHRRPTGEAEGASSGVLIMSHALGS